MPRHARDASEQVDRAAGVLQRAVEVEAGVETRGAEGVHDLGIFARGRRGTVGLPPRSASASRCTTRYASSRVMPDSTSASSTGWLNTRPCDASRFARMRSGYTTIPSTIARKRTRGSTRAAASRGERSARPTSARCRARARARCPRARAGRSRGARARARRAARTSPGCACAASRSSPSARRCGTAPRPRAPRCAGGGGSRARRSRSPAPSDAHA